MLHPENVRIGSLNFDVWTAGPEAGEPVMLLHGWPQDGLVWEETAELLAADGFRVIAPDQRGYSPDARPEGAENYHIDLLANDVLSIGSAMGAESFHLAGHDWGSAVSWWLAGHYPDRVRSLTAVSIPHLAAFGRAVATDTDQQQRSSYMDLFREPGAAESALMDNDGAGLQFVYGKDITHGSIVRLVTRFSEPGAMTASLNWYRAMGSDMARLPNVTVPTTYVWGNDDMAAGRVGAEMCASFVDGDYRFVEIEAGHWLPDTHPALIATEIAARARGIAPGATSAEPVV